MGLWRHNITQTMTSGRHVRQPRPEMATLKQTRTAENDNSTGGPHPLKHVKQTCHYWPCFVPCHLITTAVVVWEQLSIPWSEWECRRTNRKGRGDPLWYHSHIRVITLWLLFWFSWTYDRIAHSETIFIYRLWRYLRSVTVVFLCYIIRF